MYHITRWSADKVQNLQVHPLSNESQHNRLTSWCHDLRPEELQSRGFTHIGADIFQFVRESVGADHLQS